MRSANAADILDAIENSLGPRGRAPWRAPERRLSDQRCRPDHRGLLGPPLLDPRHLGVESPRRRCASVPSVLQLIENLAQDHRLLHAASWAAWSAAIEAAGETGCRRRCTCLLGSERRLSFAPADGRTLCAVRSRSASPRSIAVRRISAVARRSSHARCSILAMPNLGWFGAPLEPRSAPSKAVRKADAGAKPRRFVFCRPHDWRRLIWALIRKPPSAWRRT